MLNRTNSTTRFLWSVGGALALSFLLDSCSKMLSRPPERVGPPALVMHDSEPRLWLFLKQEEDRVLSVGGGRHNTGTTIIETLYHFDLQAHDTRTTDRIWKTRLLTLKDKDGGHTTEARLLGQDGNVVWLYLNDQAVAVSSKDGSRLADGKSIGERNPALQGLIPKELKFYAFDNALVLTAADSRRYKVRPPDYNAEPYQPADEEQFTRLQYMSTTWNGGYATNDFLVWQATFGGGWLGLYTEKEAADAGNDEFGGKLENPTSVIHESSGVRRAFWRARIGQTREFSEGRHDRLFDLRRVPDVPDFLDGGFLVRQGTRQPLALEDPAGLLVLHLTRLDEAGRIALTRLGPDLNEKWTSKMPFTDLRNRIEFPDRLLMYGLVQVTEKGVTGSQECIAALDLRDGRTQVWNVTLDRSIPAAELE